MLNIMFHLNLAVDSEDTFLSYIILYIKIKKTHISIREINDIIKAFKKHNYITEISIFYKGCLHIR